MRILQTPADTLERKWQIGRRGDEVWQSPVGGGRVNKGVAEHIYPACSVSTCSNGEENKCPFVF
jgi:hypothetical protein